MAVTLNKANLVLKDANGNIGKIEQLSNRDLAKIKTAMSDVALVVNQSNHKPIVATTTNVGVVQLADDEAIAAGTTGRVVDAKQLQDAVLGVTPANCVTNVAAGSTANKIKVTKDGYTTTIVIDNVEHAVTATSANSVTWANVSGKPSTYTPSSHDHIRYGLSFDNICADTNTGWYESRYKAVGDNNNTHLYINDYFGIHFHTLGSFDVNGNAIIHEGNIGSHLSNYLRLSGGNITGNLTVQNKNVIRSINGINADAAGNVQGYYPSYDTFINIPVPETATEQTETPYTVQYNGLLVLYSMSAGPLNHVRILTSTRRLLASNIENSAGVGQCVSLPVVKGQQLILSYEVANSCGANLYPCKGEI